MWMYLDDERYPTPEFDKVFRTNNFIFLFRNGEALIKVVQDFITNYHHAIDGISFDNDLGDTSGGPYSEGYRCLDKILFLMADTELYIPKIRIHTDNSAAASNMVRAVNNFNKHFGDKKPIEGIWDPAYASDCDTIIKLAATKNIMQVEALVVK